MLSGIAFSRRHADENEHGDFETAAILWCGSWWGWDAPLVTLCQPTGVAADPSQTLARRVHAPVAVSLTP